MIVAKYLSNKLFHYIDPWVETLSSIAWPKTDYFHHTLKPTTCQYGFVREFIFSPSKIVDCKVITTTKNFQVNIDNNKKTSNNKDMNIKHTI